jgi:hypothetical protein
VFSIGYLPSLLVPDNKIQDFERAVCWIRRDEPVPWVDLSTNGDEAAKYSIKIFRGAFDFEPNRSAKLFSKISKDEAASTNDFKSRQIFLLVKVT